MYVDKSSDSLQDELKGKLIARLKNSPDISFAQIIYYKVDESDIKKATHNREKSLVIYQSETEMVDIFSQVMADAKEKYGNNISLTDRIYNNLEKKKNIFFHANHNSTDKFIIEDNDFLKISNCTSSRQPLSTKSNKPFYTQTLEEQFHLLRFVSPDNKSAVYSNLLPLVFNTHDTQTKDIFDLFFYSFYSTKEDRYIYYFVNPVLNIDNRNINDGGLILYCSQELSNNEVKEIELVFTKWSSALTLETYVTIIRQKSIKSSKAAIISRNMSHNLGSHVMTYLKQKLSSVESVVEQRVLADLIDHKNFNHIHKKLLDDKIELPFLVGLGRFINYLQERQDYVATVATDYVPAKTTISFKDFIYDELKPDLRYERHKGDKGIIGRKPDNILLSYIAFSEGYTCADDITIKFKDFNGKMPISDAEKESFTKLRKFEIALPGGTVGRQAFFSVMENIIRNTAKHAGNNSRRMEIIIDLLENADELDKIINENDITDSSIKDKLKISYSKNQYKVSPQLYNKCKNKYYILTITANKPNDLETIKTLRNGIVSNYTGDDKDNYKGIKEMRISAAWMRGYEMDTDIKMEKEPPALAVRGVNYNRETEKCAIQYVICLPKPRKIAFVVKEILGKDLNNSIEDLNNSIDKYGWHIFSDDNKEIADYDIIVISKHTTESVKENIIKDIKQNAHARIYEDADLSHASIKKYINKIDSFTDEEDQNKEKSKILADYYKNWICQKQTFGIEENELPWLIVCDEKAEKEHRNPRYLSRVACYGSNTNNVEEKGCILYATHYESALTINASHEKEGYTVPEACFIEGISGANSTDRLIRKSEWTPEWQYKHILAGLTKVAIIDERIFSYVCPQKVELLDEKKVKELKQKIKNNGIVGQRYESEKMVGEEVNNLLDEIYLDENKILAYREELMSYIIDENIDINAIPKLSRIDDNIERIQKFYEKGILIYNMDFLEYSASKEISIVGYDIDIAGNKLNNYKSAKIGKVGTIIQDESKEIKIDLTKHKNAFHFILIHQSLLDKIYDFFELKTDSEILNLTNKLHEVFYKNIDNIKYEKLNVEENNYTLPQLIIHSGRSKPSSKDMPQHQPFIQFSAVENAVKDCKYTLSELLYSAHYEKNSNYNEN
jgi:hypothetical protein